MTGPPNTHGGPIGGECSCPWKPANKKGVQHSECCFHDEPDITVCTCGAGERDKDRRRALIEQDAADAGEALKVTPGQHRTLFPGGSRSET